MRILVVDDDPSLAGFLVKALEEASHAVDRAGTAAEARRLLAGGDYGLLSLDWNLPDGTGMDLLREVRAAGNAVPVLLLTSRGEVADRVDGLDGGADDFLAKPFALDEYLSRVRALLRRAGTRADPVLRMGALACDEVARRVTVAGREVELTGKEFALLRELLRSPGAVLSRTQLVNRVWKYAFDGYSNVVDVHVSALRRKLRGAGIRFRAVPRVGYVLEEDAGDRAP